MVSVTGAISASFAYDGDSRRVKSTIGGVETYFVGNYYEVTGSTATKYYYAGGQRLAMRVGSADPYFILSDHLGSTTVTTDSSGNAVGELRYAPWGEVRAGNAPTSYTYTGQYSNTSDFGLMFYNARWYDPALSRFTSADTIVGAGAMGWDRYAYVNSSPVNFTDPSGHFVVEDESCTQLSCSGDPEHEVVTGQTHDGAAGPLAEGGIGTSCFADIAGCYMGGWYNFGGAWSVYSDPNAAAWARVRAGLFMGLWMDGHVLLAGGAVLLVREGVVVVVAQIATRNPDATMAMIGRYISTVDNYTLQAGERFTYLDLGRAYSAFDALGLAKPANQQFIYNQMRAGKPFAMYGQPMPLSNLLMEVDMLLQSGRYSAFQMPGRLISYFVLGGR